MVLDIQDPRITRTIRTGYPEPVNDEPYGEDFFGNEVFPGDEILVLDDEFFLKEHLSYDAIEILRHFGATEEIAK